MIVTRKPREVKADGKPLAESAIPLRREPGWWWDDKRGRLFVTVTHAGDKPVAVEILR